MVYKSALPSDTNLMSRDFQNHPQLHNSQNSLKAIIIFAVMVHYWERIQINVIHEKRCTGQSLEGLETPSMHCPQDPLHSQY